MAMLQERERLAGGRDRQTVVYASGDSSLACELNGRASDVAPNDRRPRRRRNEANVEDCGHPAAGSVKEAGLRRTRCRRRVPRKRADGSCTPARSQRMLRASIRLQIANMSPKLPCQRRSGDLRAAQRTVHRRRLMRKAGTQVASRRAHPRTRSSPGIVAIVGGAS